jgi:hypothetical protein
MSADGEAELCSEKDTNAMSDIHGYTHGTRGGREDPP